MRRERLLRRLAPDARTCRSPCSSRPRATARPRCSRTGSQDDPRPVAWLDARRGGRRPGSAHGRRSRTRSTRPADLTLADAGRRDRAARGAVRARARRPPPPALAPRRSRVVTAVADAVPAGSQVVVAGRWEPDLPIGRLRAQGRLIDLRARDLVMTRREAAAMLEPGGSRPPAGGHQRAARADRGLAGRSLPRRPLARRRTRTSTGRSRASAATTGCSPTTCATSCSDRLDAEQLALPRVHVGARRAVRAAVRRGAAAHRLRQPCCATCRARTCSSCRSTTPTGRTATTRSSPACSRRSCVARDPQCEAELHRRASDWYAGAGDADRAIDHAIDAGDAARAGTLLWGPRPRGCSTAAAPTSGAGSIASRPSQIAAHPTLALTAAAHHLALGERDLSSTGPRPPSCHARRDRRPRRCTPASQAMRAAVARGRHRARCVSRRRARVPSACPRTARGGRSAACCAASATHLRGDADRGPAPPRGGRAARRDRRARASRRCASRSWRCSRSTPTTGSRGRCSPHALGRRSTASACERHPTVRARLRGVGARARAPRPRRGRPGGPAPRRASC